MNLLHPNHIQSRSIDSPSFPYQILRHYIKFCLRYFYYSKVEVYAESGIPEDKPCIITPNHQNALMDALNILAFTKKQPVFLARADIFRQKTIVRILSFLKIAPIFRIRDGKETLKQNDLVFESSVGILERKNILVMFPEGTHGDREILRVLKKGVARIAFLSEEKNQFLLDVKIIPAGLVYSDYYSFRGKVFIYIGNAFSIHDFTDVYSKNPPQAFTSFNEKLGNEMKRVMIHIKDEENYGNIQFLRSVYLDHLVHSGQIGNSDLKARFLSSKSLINALEFLSVQDNKRYHELSGKTGRFKTMLSSLNIENEFLTKPIPPFFKPFLLWVPLLVFLPLFLTGAIIHYLPFKIPVWFCNKKIKDKQFHSSVRFALYTLVTFPLFYLFFFVTLSFSLNFLTALMVIILCPFAGMFAWNYLKVSGRFMNYLRVCRAFSRQKEEYLQALYLKKEILKEMDSFVIRHIIADDPHRAAPTC